MKVLSFDTKKEMDKLFKKNKKKFPLPAKQLVKNGFPSDKTIKKITGMTYNEYLESLNIPTNTKNVLVKAKITVPDSSTKTDLRVLEKSINHLDFIIQGDDWHSKEFKKLKHEKSPISIDDLKKLRDYFQAYKEAMKKNIKK